MANTTQCTVIFANILGLASLTGVPKVTEAVAVLADTMFACLATTIIYGTVGSRITRSAVTLLGRSVTYTSATAFFAVKFSFRAHFHYTTVVTSIL